ncbi:hypothetical protein GCM10010377_56550 [Streptomyces viridiviolaceus]|nr:hypothetical protein GCM10010377_56550 [Streptomyces viridiviolaceus]
MRLDHAVGYVLRLDRVEHAGLVRHHLRVVGQGREPVNALRALDAIGCAEACMAVGYSTTAWGQMLDVDGNLIREMPGARIPGSALPPMNGLTRPQLHPRETRRPDRRPHGRDRPDSPPRQVPGPADPLSGPAGEPCPGAVAARSGTCLPPPGGARRCP